MRSRFTFMVLLLAFVLASVAFGQKLNSEEVRLWEDICFANLEKHPNPNRWAVGDTMLIPPAFFGRWEYVIVNSDIAQHPWVVTKNLNDGVIQSRELMPTPNTVTNKPGEKRSIMDRILDWEQRFLDRSRSWNYDLLLLALAVLTLCGLLYWLYRQYWQRQSEKNQPQPPFVQSNCVPSYETAQQSEIDHVAAYALGHVYGPVTLLGSPERGRLNGTFTVFFSDGTRSTETYHDEPGFKARVRLANGREATVYCRWQCFNPVRGAESVDASGVTFTPEGSNQHYVVKSISEAEANEISHSILTNTNATPAAFEPAAKSEPTDSTTAPAVDHTTKPLHVTKLDFSRGRVTWEGEGWLTVEEYERILDRMGSDKGDK